jgi:hypothetical protein
MGAGQVGFETSLRGTAYVPKGADDEYKQKIKNLERSWSTIPYTEHKSLIFPCLQTNSMIEAPIYVPPVSGDPRYELVPPPKKKKAPSLSKDKEPKKIDPLNTFYMYIRYITSTGLTFYYRDSYLTYPKYTDKAQVRNMNLVRHLHYPGHELSSLRWETRMRVYGADPPMKSPKELRDERKASPPKHLNKVIEKRKCDYHRRGSPSP